MPDPLSHLRRSLGLRAGLAILSSITLATWALLPHTRTRPQDAVQPAEDRPTSVVIPMIPMIPPLNTEVFAAARLWTPPPVIAQAPKPTPPAPPAPPIPLKLQLLGVTRDERDVLHAALYDPDTDRVCLVANGESVGAFKLTSLSATTVELSDGRGVRRLTLSSPTSAPAPGGKGGP